MLPAPSDRPRIAIVDDDPETILLLQHILSDTGDIFFSTGKPDAYSLFRKTRPDIILLDVQMPGEDGFALCSNLRRDPAFANIPVILITASADADSEVRGLAAGAVDFIPKPINSPIVKARVQTHLILKQRNDELRAGIAERRRIDAELQSSLGTLKTLTTQLPGVIFQYRLYPDGRSSIPVISRSALDAYGFSAEELREDASVWLKLVHPDDRKMLILSAWKSAKSMMPWHHEFRAILPDSSERWLLGESKPQRLKDGSILWHGYMRDVTERKAAEERERRQNSIYRALSETNEAILRFQDESTLFALVCRIAVDFGGMLLAWAGIPDDTGRIQPVSSSGEAAGYLENIVVMARPDVPEGRGPTGTSFRECRTVVVRDIGKAESTIPWVTRGRQFGIRSSTALSILRGGKPYAVLTVYSDQDDAFDEKIVRLLEGMVANISFALDNADREAESKKVLSVLQLTQYSLDKAVVPVFWISKDARIRFVNDAACRYLGYSRQELLDMTVLDIHPSLTLGEWARQWDGNAESERRVFEAVHRSREGRMIPVEITSNRVHYHGEEYSFAFVVDISERKRSEEVIWRQANYDELTGLPNRRLFLERLDREIMAMQQTGNLLALVFLDLDFFKDINDTLGHGMGDLLLKKAADRIISCVRRIDTVARLGGDEFTIILTDLADTGSVERIVGTILARLSEPFVLEEETAYLSASIGITFCPNDASDSESLLKNADQAMYVSKGQGKNRYSYYDAALQQAALLRHQLVKHLHSALANDQFEVFYQPIVDLSNGSIYKAEALLRWRHPQRGMISPAEFIPLAEQTGMIVEIGDWVFRQAAREVKHLRKTHHPDFQISINKSAVQFRSDTGLYKTWFTHLHDLALAGDSVIIEITESLLMDSGTSITSKLDAFRQAGMQIALDDFGTGYSSLSYLKRFDLDYLKIDQSFVRNLTAESDDMVLCEAIIVMAHKLGIRVIAEGVETEEQRALLTAAECDYGQGYLFSRPVPAERLEQLLGSMDMKEESPPS